MKRIDLRRAVVAAAMCAAVGSLAACGGSDDPSSADSTGAAAADSSTQPGVTASGGGISEWTAAQPATREMQDSDLPADIDGWAITAEETDLPNHVTYGKGDSRIVVMVSQPADAETIDILWDDISLFAGNQGVCGTIDDRRHCALNTSDFGQLTIGRDTMPNPDGSSPPPAGDEDISKVAEAVGEHLWAGAPAAPAGS